MIFEANCFHPSGFLIHVSVDYARLHVIDPETRICKRYRIPEPIYRELCNAI
jgi:hypothetical protein